MPVLTTRAKVPSCLRKTEKQTQMEQVFYPVKYVKGLFLSLRICSSCEMELIINVGAF